MTQSSSSRIGVSSTSSCRTTIYQFEHKQGVVQKIDINSAQLAESLNSGCRIIITTLQKFSFVLDKIEDLPKRNYALIVDEAHSSPKWRVSIELATSLGGKFTRRS